MRKGKGKSSFMPEENAVIEPPDVYVLKGRLRVNQPEKGGLRTSLDTVMLAAACLAKPGDHILDLGCGVGAAGLCVLARVPGTTLSGVDIDPDLINLAKQNAEVNGVRDASKFWVADVLDPAFAVAELVDHVICNPPYLRAGTYTISPDETRARALGHQGRDADLEKWLRAAHRVLKSRGTLTIIHRADYLDQILAGLGPRFGATEIIPLWPRAGADAKRVIVRTVKDRQASVTLRAGIILHEGQDWSEDARAILEDMISL